MVQSLLGIAVVSALLGYVLANRLSRQVLRRMTAVGLGSIGLSLAGLAALGSGIPLGVHPYAAALLLLLLLVIGSVLLPLGIVGLVFARSSR